MIAATIARVKAQAPAFKLADGGLAFAALAKGKLPPRHLLPAAYVLELREDATGRRLVGQTNHQITTRIGVITCSARPANVADKDLPDLIQAQREEIKAALIGWSPAAGLDTFLYAGFLVLAVVAGAVWEQIQFTTGHLEQT